MTVMKFNQNHPKRKRSKRPPITATVVFSLLICGLVIVSATVIAQDNTGYSQTSRSSQGPRAGSVTIDYEGFTIPKFDILVAATEIGRLEEVNVKIGERVSQGQIVAKLEDGLQVEAVATARWRAQMHGETDAAKAETALMKLRYEQLQSLADRDIARPDELKRAFADWEIAKARELNAVEQDQLRKLELSRYELQLRRRKVFAPKDGVVAELFHAPGEYITPADPAVIRLVVLDQIYGVFNVPVEEIGMIHLGDQVQVFMSSASKTVRGEVASIAPDIDGESGTIMVKVLLDNQAGELRAGDRCRMRPARNQTAQRERIQLPVTRRIGAVAPSTAPSSRDGVSGIR